MRTRQLSLMVRDLRAEAGHALGVAQGTNNYETLKYLLARTQEELWTAFTWPDLGTRGDVPMVAGQYLYAFPASMTYDMVRETWTADGASDNWHHIPYGIDESMVAAGSLDNISRADPVQAWDVEGEQFRVYPTPDIGGGWVRFKGQRQLAPFVADSDVSTIDATCIVLFTAADLLARAKAEDAAVKMQKAQRHVLKLLGNKIAAKNRGTSLGGGSPGYRPRHSNLLYGPGA
jgi:hypothetical protein